MTDTNLDPARYAPRFNETQRTWEVYDRETKRAFGSFDTKFQAGRRATQLQVLHNKKRRENYGMQHPVNAPAPRAYKD